MLKVTAVCLTAYAASLLTILGTVSFISTTSLAPTHVSASARSLASSVRSSVASLTSSPSCGSAEDGLDGVPGVPDMPQGLEDLDGNLMDIRPSAAEFLTASLLVATLTSGGPAAGDLDMKDYSEYGGRSRGGKNQSSASSEDGTLGKEDDDVQQDYSEYGGRSRGGKNQSPA